MTDLGRARSEASLAWDELIRHVEDWQSRGKTAWWKLDGSQAPLELGRRLPVGGVDEGVGVGEGEPHLSCCSMKARRRGTPASGGPLVGILLENRSGAERLCAGRFVRQLCFLLDLFNEAEDLKLVLLWAQVRPARKLLEDNALGGGDISIPCFLSATAGVELLGSVVPRAGEVSPFSQRSGAVDAGPVERTQHKAFLAGLREDVAQSTDERCLLVADPNRPVSAAPDLLSPAVEAACFFGEVCLDAYSGAS